MGLFFTLLGALFERNNYSHRAKRDQNRVRTTFKNCISPINSYGTCFSCNGSGKKTFDCKKCDSTGTFTGTCRNCEGTGIFKLPAKPCLSCQSTGTRNSKSCNRCNGTGNYIKEVECRRCSGKGTFTVPCSKCDGSGDFEVDCRKCGGSGWHRF